jgi:quercetin dioxygenase-like cupin family protein
VVTVVDHVGQWFMTAKSSITSPQSREPQMAAEPQSTEEEAPGTPPPAFKRTDLQRSPSPVSGWEIRQTLVEIPEGIESGRHSHPGPEVGYIVRGVVSMEFDDGTALALRTGDPFLIAPGVIHNARNVGTVTTKMLSTYFVDETQPLVTLY